MNRYIISDLGNLLPDDLLFLKVQVFYGYHPLRTIPNPMLKRYKYASLQLRSECKFLEFKQYKPAWDRLIAYSAEIGDLDMMEKMVEWYITQDINDTHDLICGYRDAGTSDIANYMFDILLRLDTGHIDWRTILCLAAENDGLSHIKRIYEDETKLKGAEMTALILTSAVKVSGNEEMIYYLFDQIDHRWSFREKSYRQIFLNSICSNDMEMIEKLIKYINEPYIIIDRELIIKYVTHIRARRDNIWASSKYLCISDSTLDALEVLTNIRN